jgi:hypothetical protein
MKNKHFIYLSLFLALTWGCTQEDAIQTSTLDQKTFTRATDPKLETELQQLMEEAKEGLNNSSNLRSNARVVWVPDGSRNVLQSAIYAAKGGIVLLESGEHYESRTVTIDRKVTILCDDGAVLISKTSPSLPTSTTITLQPVIHILNAKDVYIGGLELRAEGGIGNTGILVENSPGTKLVSNKITQYQFCIIFEKSDNSTAYFNTLSTTTIWQTGDLVDVYGIVNVNGEGVRITSNDISGSMLGIWACSTKGFVTTNYFHDNLIGLLLCKAPENVFKFPDGHLNGSQLSGNNWLVTKNNAVDNLDAGYVVIDGANNNLLQGNWAGNNARVDYEIAGDSERFGFFTPKAFNNTLYAQKGQSVQDCGVNSTIVGGELVDNRESPCF